MQEKNGTAPLEKKANQRLLAGTDFFEEQAMFLVPKNAWSWEAPDTPVFCLKSPLSRRQTKN
jgi:hypothetical protein